ncbi:MAG: SIS domain-containing protein [Candidatus Nitrosotenuis sp.]
MYSVYDAWPEIAKESYQSDLSMIDFQKCSHIVFAGMGGSGAIGDIFSAILSKTNTHVTVVKGYHLPRTVDSNSVVVITSISGNTSETLAILENARKINSKIVAFSNGGKLRDICVKNNISHRNIPEYNSPRASFTSFLYSMLHVLQPIIPIDKTDIIESLKKLKDMSEKINSDKISKYNPAIEISEWINNSPIIYYPWGLQPAAIRYKNSIQENAKMQAMTEDVIESSHNGIVIWDKKNDFQPILLRGRDDYETTKERWEILKEFFKTRKIEYKEIMSQDGNILTKIICLVYLLDYSSIYLAVKLGIDPTPVDAINFVKNRLTNQVSVG